MSDSLLVIAAGFLLAACDAPRPSGLGAQDGRLAPCPSTPNCVSSQAPDAEHRVDPICYSIAESDALAVIRMVVESFPRTRTVSATGNYLHAEFTSAIFRFVDDVEFLVDESAKTVHIRSASRVGRWDLGVNRRRVENQRQSLMPRLSRS